MSININYFLLAFLFIFQSNVFGARTKSTAKAEQKRRRLANTEGSAVKQFAACKGKSVKNHARKRKALANKIFLNGKGAILWTGKHLHGIKNLKSLTPEKLAEGILLYKHDKIIINDLIGEHQYEVRGKEVVKQQLKATTPALFIRGQKGNFVLSKPVSLAVTTALIGYNKKSNRVRYAVTTKTSLSPKGVKK